MDQPSVRDYSAVYLNVLPLLSPEARNALNVVSQHTGASSVSAQKDNTFWKRRFEELVGKEYPADQSPGVTTWHHKVKIVERHGVKGLLLSDELLDIEAAIRVVNTDSLTRDEKREIIGHALLGGNTRIIMLMATVPGLKFKKYASKAVMEGVEMLEKNETVITIFDDVPPAVLKLIMHPMFGLRFDVPQAILDNMPHISVATLTVLINDPHAMLVQNGENYLLTAWEEARVDAFFVILDHPDVTLRVGVFGDLYDEDDVEMTAEFLKHPKTAVFLQ